MAAIERAEGDGDGARVQASARGRDAAGGGLKCERDPVGGSGRWLARIGAVDRARVGGGECFGGNAGAI